MSLEKTVSIRLRRERFRRLEAEARRQNRSVYNLVTEIVDRAALLLPPAIDLDDDGPPLKLRAG